MDVHRLWLVTIPQERRLRHVILGDVVFQTREGYLLLAGGVGAWDRPKDFDKAKLLMRFNLIMLRRMLFFQNRSTSLNKQSIS